MYQHVYIDLLYPALDRARVPAYATCKEATAARRVHTRAVSVPRAAEILLIPHGRRDGSLP